jgi:hypothetical protein
MAAGTTPARASSAFYHRAPGHLRHAALVNLGSGAAPRLIADDDEAFTYNKRVNRLATVQEHYMIVKAIERGVSEDKLARALNVDIKRIKTKRTLLDGVCPEVAEMLKDKSVGTAVFALPRKMKPLRQIEAIELMSAMNNFTARYAQALLAATRQDDLSQPNRPKKIGGLTPEQMARMEREMDGLQREFKTVSASYGDTVLNLGRRRRLRFEPDWKRPCELLSRTPPPGDPHRIQSHCHSDVVGGRRRQLIRSGCFSELRQHLVSEPAWLGRRSMSKYTHCGSCVLSRAIPCSDRVQQRHKIIRKRVALLGDESVSVVTVGTGPAPTGDPTHARLHHRQ